MTASPRDIIVFMEQVDNCAGRLGYAAALAARFGAGLIAAWIARPLDTTPEYSFAVGAGLRDMLQTHRAKVAAAAARMKEVFDEQCARHGIDGEWRFLENESDDALIQHARHADLAIIAPPAGWTDPRQPPSMSEELIFASGRPAVLVPAHWPEDRLPRRIVIGWNCSRESTRAVADAMPLLTAAASVHVVVVPEDRTRRLGGAEPGADIARHLARHGITVTLDQIEGDDAGAVLLRQVRVLDADLLVMGAYGRSRIREFIFGGATRTILRDAGIPVLMSC